MSVPSEQHPEHEVPGEFKPLVRELDRRGASQRGALSPEALERIASMSEMQLPMALPESPVVIARIGPSGSTGRSFAHPRAWLRIAAAVATAAVIGGAAWLLSRGSSDEPAPGTLVQDAPTDPLGDDAAVAVRPSPEFLSPDFLSPDFFELVIARAASVQSASAVVVALSGAAEDPAVHYHDIDDALAADIAPIFHSGSLLDGGGTTYDDLSGEFAAIVASMPLRETLRETLLETPRETPR